MVPVILTSTIKFLTSFKINDKIQHFKISKSMSDECMFIIAPSLHFEE